MSLLLVRYGEIALKGQNRTYFYRKLRQNLRRSLAADGIVGQVRQEGQRIFVETDQLPAAVDAVRRVFGVVSLSPVDVVPPELSAMAQGALQVAQRAGLNAQRTFRVRTNRPNKSFPLTSPEIDRQVGAAVVAATAARVDLTHSPDLEIGIEVQADRALVFGEVIPGPGGLPLGSQGRVVALLSGGIDSPVAAWLMMKRGCGVLPVHFSTDPAQAEKVLRIVDALNRYAHGHKLKPIVLSHEEILGPDLDELRQQRAQRWTCLFCKRRMLQEAARVAVEHGAGAIITGESLGQVASQTLSNLEVISHGISKPILRPLIGLDKTEIMALARQIGTYELSIQEQHACPYLPSQPLTQGSVARLQELLSRIQECRSLDGEAAEGLHRHA